MDARARQRRNFLLGLGLAVAVVLRLTARKSHRIPPPPTSTNTPTGDTQAPPPGVSGEALSERARATLRERLATAPAGSPVWLAAPGSSPGAVRLAQDLAEVFSRAGWRVVEVSQLDWAVRPGIHLYAADPTPPPYFDLARNALAAAGITLGAVGIDYRAYYAERNGQPNWRGVAMAPEQTWVVLVGRTQ